VRHLSDEVIDVDNSQNDGTSSIAFDLGEREDKKASVDDFVMLKVLLRARVSLFFFFIINHHIPLPPKGHRQRQLWQGAAGKAQGLWSHLRSQSPVQGSHHQAGTSHDDDDEK
jgi:hypothetical protein